jgi:high-affinity iron transporter
VAAAALLGILLFRGALRIRIGHFFTVMNVILVLFAAGLVAHGIHELQEAGVLPALVEQLWNLNPSYAEGAGTVPPLHEDGAVGGILKGLFGYNGNPSLIELLAYALYLGAAVFLWLRFARRASPQPGAP